MFRSRSALVFGSTAFWVVACGGGPSGEVWFDHPTEVAVTPFGADAERVLDPSTADTWLACIDECTADASGPRGPLVSLRVRDDGGDHHSTVAGGQLMLDGKEMLGCECLNPLVADQAG